VTKRQRAQVVELLRCAVDIAVTRRWWPFGIAITAACWVQHGKKIDRLATKAATDVAGGTEGCMAPKWWALRRVVVEQDGRARQAKAADAARGRGGDRVSALAIAVTYDETMAKERAA
jgi:hypothetical protein